MNSIGKHLNLIGIILLTVIVGAAAGLYFDAPSRAQNPRAKRVGSQQYTCPMHPDVVSAKPGSCPRCAMALVPASKLLDGQADGGGQHPDCCAAESATELRLPPGHPPIPGWPTNAVKPAP